MLGGYCRKRRISRARAYNRRIASSSIPIPGPLANPVLEDLKDSWPNVMLCVEPWYGDISMERGLPLEAAVGQASHAEEGHG